MKRCVIAALCMAFLASALCAYNPPVNGENFNELVSPWALTTGASSAGGPLFRANSESLMVNPALPASEQRVNLVLAYTALISSNGENEKPYGNAFEGGILIPFKWAVFTGNVNGVMSQFNEMQLGDSINMKFGLAKEVTDKLSVGLNLNTGIFWGADTDWGLSANLGFLYRYGNLGFMKNFRYSGAVLNLGKNYGKTTLTGVNPEDAVTQFPMIATVRAGVAGSFYENDIIKVAGSLDLTTPAFQNLIADLALQISVKDSLYINVGEKFNLVETINGHKNLIPSVGINFKFTFDIKNNEYIEKNGWSQSELSGAVAWKQLYTSVNAISAGLDLNLGLKDETPPVIHLWIDEDELEGGNE